MKKESKSRPSKKQPRAKARGPSTRARAQGPVEHRWTFLSNHAHVLICLARDPGIRLREVAEQIGITERAVQNILSDLEVEGLVERHREGRRNSYELSLDHPLHHPLEKHRNVDDLVGLFLG